MRKRCRTWVGLFVLVGVALAVYFEPTCCVRGWLHGEAFFDGRPTSYWRSLVEAEIAGHIPLDQDFKLSFWESVCQKCGISTERQWSNELITQQGSDAVLAELRRDRSPRVRAFAEAIIAFNTNELPELAKTTFSCGTDILIKSVAWRRAVGKARAIPDED